MSATETAPRPTRAPSSAGRDATAGSAPGSSLRRNLVATLAIVVVLVGWEVVPRALRVQSFIFPPLSDVLIKLVEPNTVKLLQLHTPVTVYEAVVGLLTGVLSGVVMGFVLAEWELARNALYPFIVAFQSMPKVALAPLFIIWFGFGYAPKVLVVVMLVFFPMLVNTMNGILSTDRSRIDLFQSLSATKWQIWSRLLLPSALPSIFAGLEVAVVNSFIGAITGEFVGATGGLGVLLQQFKTNYDTPGVFAILIVLAVIGILLNLVVRVLRRILIFWQG